MTELRNLTLHPQGPAEVDLARASGYALAEAPEGVLARVGPGGLEDATAALAGRLADCASRGASALTGGHTGLWIAALELLAARGVRRPWLCYFETERRRDSEGRFVFRPLRLVRLPPPRGPARAGP